MNARSKEEYLLRYCSFLSFIEHLSSLFVRLSFLEFLEIKINLFVMQWMVSKRWCEYISMSLDEWKGNIISMVIILLRHSRHTEVSSMLKLNSRAVSIWSEVSEFRKFKSVTNHWVKTSLTSSVQLLREESHHCLRTVSSFKRKKFEEDLQNFVFCSLLLADY